MVLVEVVGPDHVFVEGDTISNKDWLGLLKALSDRGLLGDL